MHWAGLNRPCKPAFHAHFIAWGWTTIVHVDVIFFKIMKNIKILPVCLCCALVGMALGAGFGRGPEPGEGVKVGAGKKADMADSRVAVESGCDGHAAVNSDEYPDLAGLKTPEQWRGYIGRWITEACPSGQWRNVFECLRCWSIVDADAALAFVDEAARFPKRKTAYAVPLTMIGARDMGRVIDWLQKNISESDRRDIAGTMIMWMKDTHIGEARKLALADGIHVDSRYFGEIMQTLLQTNPLDSLRMLEGLPDYEKARVAGGFAVTWLEMDEKAALEWCARQKDESYGSAVFFDVLNHYAKEKPLELITIIEKLEVVFEPTQYYGLMLRNLVKETPLIALEVLQKMPADVMAQFGNIVVPELFKTDADQAVAVARVIWPEDDRCAEMLFHDYQGWINSDRKAAETWLETEADAALREQIKTMQLVSNDPLAFLVTVGAGTNINSPFMEKCISDAVKNAVFNDQCDEVFD